MKRVLLILLASLLVLGSNGVASGVYVYFQYPIADAMVEDGLKSFINFGAEDRISTRGYAVATGGSRQRSYLKFDLTEIVEVAGPDPMILRATFGIMLVEHNPGGFFTGGPLVSLHYVSDDTWIESGAGGMTWNNKPGFAAEEMDVPKNTVGEDVYYTWDLLDDWDSSVDLAEGGPLLSLMIKANDETTNNYAIFYSREDTGVEVQPFLQIEYIPSSTYTASAYDDAENKSAQSGPVQGLVFDTEPPGVVQSLTMTGKTDMMVPLPWDVSTDDMGSERYRSYLSANYMDSLADIFCMDIGLDFDTTYTVRACDGADNNQPKSDGVQGPKATIQAGIDSAGDGDTIEVTAGTYNEDVYVNSGIVVRFSGNSTIIGQLETEAGSGIKCDGSLTITSRDGCIINRGNILAEKVHLVGKQIVNSGTIDASGNIGGAVTIHGGSVTLAADSIIHADGTTGDGGHVELRADGVVLSTGSLTTANAGTNGDGGEVIVFSPDTALFWPDAQIEAKGGTSSGDGGFVEVSGKESMIFEGKVDLTASNGGHGTLLIDPKNITINDTGADVVADNDEFLENFSGDVEFSDENIEAALDGANLTLQANTDITVIYPVDSSAGAGGDLTLQAGRRIDIDEDITLNGSFSATADDLAAEPTERDPGPGDIDIATGATIDTSGSISLSGESVNVRGYLESGSDVTINATNSVWVGQSGTPRDLVVSNGELAVTSENEGIHLSGITESKGDMTLDAETFISADDDIISTEGSVSIYTVTDNTSLWGDLKANDNVLLSTNLELGGGEWLWDEDLGAWIWDSINLIEATTGTITAEGWIWKRFPSELHMYAGAPGTAINLLYDGFPQPTVQTGGNLYMYGIGDIQIAGDPTAIGTVFPAPFPFPEWGEEPVLMPWDMGGVSVISENGKIYTEGATPQNALDIMMQGFCDDISHRMDWTGHVPPYFTKFPPAAGVDLPIKDEGGNALGKAAIVLKDKQSLKLTEGSYLLAYGVCNPLDTEPNIPGVDDRPGIDFLDTDNTTIGGHVRDEGIPPDVAIYAASTQGDVEVYTEEVRVIYMPLENIHEPVETGPATVVFDAYDTVRFPFLEGVSSFTDLFLKMMGFPTVEDYLDFIGYSLDDFLTIVGYPTFEEYAEFIIKEMMSIGNFRVEVCSRITEWLSQAIADQTLPFADDTTFMEELYEDYVLRGAGDYPDFPDQRAWVLDEYNLPDLVVTSEDINFAPLPGVPNQPVTITATVWNAGLSTAENIEVIFKDFDSIIGSQVISSILPADSNAVSIQHTWPKAGFRLITVTADPYDEISELYGTNNSGSKLYQVGDVGDMNAIIEVSCTAPTCFPEGTTATINGEAFYRIEIPNEPNYVYPVKGGSVSAEFFDSNGVQLNLIELFSDTEGAFAVSFPVPGAANDVFDVNIAVTDTNLVGTWEQSFDVCPPVPKKDLWVADVNFSGSEPNITIGATVFARSDNTVTLYDVPATFSVYPPEDGNQIGSTQYITEIGPNDSNTVSVTWYNAPNGVYCIEVKLWPGFSDDNNGNNQATRPLVVGPAPQWLNVDINTPSEGADVNASDTTLVTVSVTDDNGNVMIPCVLETLTLDFNGVEERQVDLKTYFNWGISRYVYSWQPPTDANGQACLEVTAQIAAILGDANGSDLICVDVNDNAPPSFSIYASPYWAKIGQSVWITVNASEPLLNDKPDSNTVTDSYGQPILFSLSAHDPCSTQWVYQTIPLPPGTAFGKATIMVTGKDRWLNAGSGTAYFYVIEVVPDFWVHSEDISFSDGEPNLGDTITISAVIHGSSDNTVTVSEIPVTFYALHSTGDYQPKEDCQIGETQYTGQIAPGGNDTVSVLWTNAAEGWYIIEVELGPEFSDRNYKNNQATRAILVGDQCFVTEDFDCDGVYNEYDNCPGTYNPDQADDDGDGAGNACDDCPTDPDKVYPGICGCGIPDTDSDSDGMSDCNDNCPNDANPSQVDSDGDGSGDLCDPCPSDSLDECDPNGSDANEIDANEGGTIETPDGALRIDIEPNDLFEDTTISVTQIVPPDPNVDLMISSNPGWGQAVAVYDLEPDGLVFNQPVTVTITADVNDLNPNQRDRLGLYLWDVNENKFVLVEDADCNVVEDPCGIFTKTCTVELEHFSDYAIVLPLQWDGLASGDLTGEGEINCSDLRIIALDWLESGSIADIYPPPPDGDSMVNFWDIAVLAEHWLDVKFYYCSLDTDPGWSTTGQWAYGQPTGGGGIERGNPDPNSGYRGTNVYGVNLNGDYDHTVAGGPYYLTAGPFDCSLYYNVSLKFARWLNTDEPAYVESTIEVSSDGMSWSKVWEHTGRSDITDGSWQIVEYDINSVADGQETVYIRWGYEIHEYAYPYSGWNIDDIGLRGNPR